MDIKNILQIVKDAKKIAQEKGQAALSEAFKELFDEWPKLESISWTQYTPYFNDGDTCYFGVHDFNSIIYDGKEYDYDFSGLPKKLAKKLASLNVDIQNLEDIMADIFGDHAMITVTKSGFNIEEYEHD